MGKFAPMSSDRKDVSRVKKPIEDAREFADQNNDNTPAAANPQTAPPPAATAPPAATPTETPQPPPADQVPPESSAGVSAPRDDYVKRKTQIFVASTRTDQDPQYYTTDQGLVNTDMRARVTKCEEKYCKLCENDIGEVRKVRQAEEALAPERYRQRKEFLDTFFWPAVPPVNPEELVLDLKLQHKAEDTAKCAQLHTSLDSAMAEAGRLLDELQRDMPPEKVSEAELAIQRICEVGQMDPALSHDVVIGLHRIHFEDILRPLQQKLNHDDSDVQLLQKSLAEVQKQKDVALQKEDVALVESSMVQQIRLEEQVIAKVQSQLNDVKQYEATVNEYIQRCTETCDAAQDRVNFLCDVPLKRINDLASDNEALAAARTRKLAEDDACIKDHEKEIEESARGISQLERQQADVWIKIMELLEESSRLATEHKKAVEAHADSVTREGKRRGYVDSYVSGIEQYAKQVEEASGYASTSASLQRSIKEYTDKMCTEISELNTAAALLDYKTQIQLSYLDAYGAFKRFADELLLKKETRLMSLGRLARNLELQVKEATHVLDPNKKKYEAELVEVRKEMEATQKTIDELTQRTLSQATQWRPVEDELEEALIEFEPPDIAAERERCQRKTESLELARAFVSSEQETVDRDTMKLRKLKTSNKVAIDGVEKRRKEKHGTENEPQAIGDQPPAPTQEAAQPASAPAAASDSHTQAAEPPK